MKRLWSIVQRGTQAGLSQLLYFPYVLRLRLQRRPSRKLQVGCGAHRFPGWTNADIDPRADLIIYLERRLPFADRSLDRIYSEHVLEHVPYEVAVQFLREAWRVLAPGGVVRIAMPDLDDLVDGYCSDWRRFDWINWPDLAFVKTRAQMLNIAFRWWGHRHLYNREELARALFDAGFTEHEFVDLGQSRWPDLRGLETRLDSKLVVDAVKR
ncbi:MAG TPA: methyltransferase domain-containing protein [Polyangia bacterium]|jgi:predicted SAM-dependent methyltransferase